MFAKIFTLFALIAVAFGSPNPKPAPSPQLVTYTAGLDYVVPAAAPVGIPSVVSPYAAPLAYSALPGAVYVR